MGKKEVSVWKKVLRGIIGVFIILAAAFIIYKVYITIATPKEYMITSENYFDYQHRYECSGYASAYVLRSMGIEAEGVALYESFTDKNADGTLAPGFLWENLRNLGYQSKLLSGTVKDLEYNVSKGTPVIVLIKEKASKPYLHYVPVVGYDENYIYVADSLSYLANEKNQEHYNRKISVNDFKQLWENDIFFMDNIYITLHVK